MKGPLCPDEISLLRKLKLATDMLLLSDNELLSVCDSLDRELNLALTTNNGNPALLHVYPTFIDQIPNGCERGQYLALDLGGTNFRVLLVKLESNRESVVTTHTYPISNSLMTGESEDLFDYIALCLYEFVQEMKLLSKKLMLGFTFSFPCIQKSRKEAILTKWTKGFSCPDAVGKDIGQLLNRSISKFKQLQVQVAAIVNDTTGTLISCAYQQPACRMGVIVGTGVNICYMETKELPKPMIVNTELGAFGSRNNSLDFIRTDWDLQVDATSINSGQQVFEKMVSGMYLARIVSAILVKFVELKLISRRVFGQFRPLDRFTSSLISRVDMDLLCPDYLGEKFYTEDGLYQNTLYAFSRLGIQCVKVIDCKILQLVCSRVSRRSAHLTSAVVTSLLLRMDRQFTVIGVDGSVYRCHPDYRNEMKRTITHLLALKGATHIKFELMLSEDGSGRGAALVAAISSESDQQQTKNQPCSQCKSNISPKCRLCEVMA